MMTDTTLPNGDKVLFDDDTRHVSVIKKNGNIYDIASYDNAHQSHRRGAFTIGEISNFKLSKLTTVAVLKCFYPDESGAYLEKHGYIAS